MIRGSTQDDDCHFFQEDNWHTNTLLRGLIAEKRALTEKLQLLELNNKLEEEISMLRNRKKSVCSMNRFVLLLLFGILMLSVLLGGGKEHQLLLE